MSSESGNAEPKTYEDRNGIGEGTPTYRLLNKTLYVTGIPPSEGKKTKEGDGIVVGTAGKHSLFNVVVLGPRLLMEAYGVSFSDVMEALEASYARSSETRCNDDLVLVNSAKIGDLTAQRIWGVKIAYDLILASEKNRDKNSLQGSLSSQSVVCVALARNEQALFAL